MRILMWIVIAGTLLTPACAKQATVKEAAPGPITEIGLTYNPGMPVPGKPWPYYRVTFRSDGAAEYSGHVGAAGAKRGRIGSAAFKRLSDELIKLDYRHVKDYWPIAVDGPFDTLEIVQDGKRKRITHGSSGAWPPVKSEELQIHALMKFEKLAVAEIKRIRWLKPGKTWK
jgi:hypothetical protein